MALISCPECGNQCSDQAETCPKCGYPFKKKEVKEESSELDPMDEVVPIPVRDINDEIFPHTTVRLITTKTKEGYDANIKNLTDAEYIQIGVDEFRKTWHKVEAPAAETIYIKRKRIAVSVVIIGFVFGILPWAVYLICLSCIKPVDVVGVKVEGKESEEPEATTTESEEKKEEE